MMKEEHKEEAEKIELDYNGGEKKEGENKCGEKQKGNINIFKCFLSPYFLLCRKASVKKEA